MNDRAKASLRGAGFALLGFAAFALHDVAVKTLGATYQPFQIIFFSVLFSFPLATLMLMQDATEGTLRPIHPWWSLVRAVVVVITAFCVFYAFSNLPLAQVYALLFTMPLIITVLSIPILNEKVGLHRWAAVGMGLLGVLVVLRPGTTALGLGHLAALIGAFGGALASVIVRKIGREERAAVLMLYPMVITFLVMGAILPFAYEPMPLPHLGLMVAVSVLGFGAGLCIIAAYRNADAAVIAPMQYSQIIWAAIYGQLLFAEKTDQMTWIGTSIIIASGLYIVVRESMDDNSEHTPVLRTRSRFETGALPRVSTFLRRHLRDRQRSGR